MALEIIYDNGKWTATHAERRCGGPNSITLGESEILRELHLRIDGRGEEKLMPDGLPHVYHKGGLAIFESAGTFATGGRQRVRTACRYGANYARLVWDLTWGRGAAVTSPVELGSALLPGQWTRLLVVTRENVASPDQWRWQNLAADTALEWRPLPLALVLERQDGTRLEFSLGFDLWRWDDGLGAETVPPSLRLTMASEGVRLNRILADKPADFQPPPAAREGEVPPLGPVPECREYRFCAVLAWLAPWMQADAPLLPVVNVPFAAHRPGLEIPSGLEPMATAIGVDFSAMPCVESYLRKQAEGVPGTLPCWEHDRVLNNAKKAVRQLAALGKKGTLVATGLTPDLCLDGHHCDKKSDRLHWDLEDLLSFSSWAKTQLGPGWRVNCPQPVGWNQLPSLAGLGLPNGFDY
ncbi:MAG: hypothetical protein IJJ33_21145 [Victivallales bacterium]|nr:hypothetical protein [Victivallales bacterium]